jgi:hypothetical protein
VFYSLTLLKTIYMKNMIYLALLILIAQPQFLFSQDRQVYWVHGMGGNKNSLKTHDDYFTPKYKITSTKPGIETTSGIYGSAEKLKPLILANAASNNIIICHSMGGVNMRALYELKGSTANQYIGGMVTLGTPHSGALFANHIDDGTLATFSNDMVKYGAKGPAGELTLLATLNEYISNLTILNIFGVKELNTNDLITRIPAEIAEFVATNFATQSTTTKNSLKTTSADIARLNSKTMTIPTIAFYGVEADPAFPRFFTSHMSREQVTSITGDYGNVVPNVANFYGVTVALAQGSTEMYNYKHAMALASILVPALSIKYNFEAANWKVTKDYWNGQFQHSCDVLTGAYRTEKHTVTYTDYNDCSVPTPDDALKSTSYINPDNIWDDECVPGPYTVTETVTAVISQESDGLLPVDTPQAWPGCLTKVKVEGANHASLKWNVATRNKIEDVFNKKNNIFSARNQDFFKVDPRQ